VYALQAQQMALPSDAEKATLPLWAQRMYTQPVNVYEVDSLYRAYFSSHTFVKTYHTQYYKKWRKLHAAFIDDQGFIQIPSLAERLERDRTYREQLAKRGQRASSWSLVGPVQVLDNDGSPGNEQTNVYALDQCTANPNVMYCGTEPGEVYKSLNGGQNWVNVSINETFGSGVTAIEIDPSNPDNVFAGAGAGVFRSTNGGTTWQNTLANTSWVNEILVNPGNPSIVLAATDNGLYRSTDAGATWQVLFAHKSYDIKPNVANPAIVYLVKNNSTARRAEFFSSTDFGATWTIQTTGWYNSNDPDRNDGGARIAVTPADPNRVYAYLIGEAKAGDLGFIGVYRSNDGGVTWTLPNGPAGGPYTAAHPNLAVGSTTWDYHQGFYNCAIMASNTNADEILIGGLNLWYSNDGGQTFSSKAGYIGGPLEMHVDMQDFRAFNGQYWISTDGGMYKGTDFFNAQPVFQMSGVHGSEYWGFGSGWNKDVLVGGLYHNGNIAYVENYGAGNFLSLGGGEAPTGYVNPGNNMKTYFSDISGRYLPEFIGDPILGFTFGKSPNETYYAAESSELEFTPSCYNVAYLGNENKLWRTNDGGNSFSLHYTFGTNVNNQIKYIEIARSNEQVMYLNQQPQSGSTGTLWKTTDGGQNWVSLPIPAGNSRRMLIALSPENEKHVWIAYPSGSNGNKVFKSTDGGQTWTNISSAMLNGQQVHSILLVGGTDGGLYYCTDPAVYYRNNSMPDWTLENQGLPTYFNSNIAKPFYRDGKIRIASYGKGIWESAFTEQPSRPIAQITVDKQAISVACNRDSFYFEDYSMLNHSNATWAWTFQNGSPSTSAQRNPVVLFQGTGTFMATLTVTDGNGQQDSDTIYIEVSNYNVPSIVQEGFENSFPPVGWSTVNYDNSHNWSLATGVGGFGNSNQCAIFNNFDLDSEGTADDLQVLIELDSLVDTATLTFDVAYAEYGGQYTDTLDVWVSEDCGLTYDLVFNKGGGTLGTAPNQNTYFTPTASQWRTETVDLSAYAGNDKLIVAFRNHGHWGNNIYVDNVNIVSSSTPVAVEITPANPDVFIFPNPAASGSCVRVQLPDEQAYTIQLYDANSKRVYQQVYEGSRVVEVQQQLVPGTYIMHIRGEKHMWNKKIVVY
jgi:photosystem II stability/assembly factor-like uncharacterized protein